MTTVDAFEQPSAALVDESAIEDLLINIAESLASEPKQHWEIGGSLTGCYAGRALFFHHLGLATEDSAHLETSRAYARSGVLQARTASNAPASLYSGVAGIGWVCQHVGLDVIGEGKEGLRALDKFLLESVSRDLPYRPRFDLISGLAGVGMYFLKRLPRPDAVEGVRWIVRQLQRSKRLDERGSYWVTEPEWLLARDRAKYANGRIDLGVAHGVPGIVGFLAHAASCPEVATEAWPLLRSTVDWLIAQEFPELRKGLLPPWIALADSAPVSTARLAWCYGGLGVALPMWSAGAVLLDPEAQRWAVEMAEMNLLRDAAEDGVIDACLCHGSAGILHACTVLEKHVGDGRFAAHAQRWLARTFAMRDPARGLAGFPYHNTGDIGVQDDSTFLTGVAGVGLALLAFLSSEDSSWDRLLLMD